MKDLLIVYSEWLDADLHIEATERTPEWVGPASHEQLVERFLEERDTALLAAWRRGDLLPGERS